MRTQTIDQGVGRAHVTLLRRARTSCRRRRRTERTSAMDRLKREPKGALEERGAPKQAASPAQEATRARIASLESQLRRLKASGRLDQKTNFQVRCLEEDLRKAHSKLRRLLNEAERQRRRRERLRGGGGAPYDPPREDDTVMSTLKSCTRFQDLVRELNSLGFSLVHRGEDVTDEGDSMPEVDGVRVKVELIEGDEELEPDFKTENTSSSSCSEIPALLPADEEEECGPDSGRTSSESYRRWFERQAELQQRWEENFMRQQMELTRSLLESVTATFLQGVQQIMANIGTGRRFHPFSPDPPTS